MTKRTGRKGQIAMAAALALAAALAGCADEKSPWDPEKPLDKMTKDEWCAFYAHYLTKPNLSAATRASAVKQMHDRGCPGA